MSTIAKPFGILMMWLYNITSNYGIAIILFAIIVRLILLPFQMKSKKGTMRMTLLAPKQAELQKKYGSNQQKYNEELQKLYQEEGVNPMSGCLWSLIPFPILIALYEAIRKPLTTMMGVAAELVEEGGAIFDKAVQLGYENTGNVGYAQIQLTKFISEHFDSFSGLSDKLRQIDYSFLGLDLGATPSFKIWEFDWSNTKVLLPQLGLFMIPVVAALLTYLTTAITQKMNPPPDPSTAATTSSMNIIGPLMTLWFAFIMPGALGLYWAMGSVLSIVQEVILTKHYGKIIAAETAERDELRRKKEAELEAKRQETERLRAMNATTENANTSKKKLQAKEKAEKEKQQAEWERQQSGEDEAYEPSRVGHRKYARGRAYDPDRYTRNAVSSDADSEEASEDASGEEEQK